MSIVQGHIHADFGPRQWIRLDEEKIENYKKLPYCKTTRQFFGRVSDQ
jgi:hypothetical protein